VIIEITSWRSLRHVHGRRKRLEWGRVVKGLERCAQRPHDGRGWSPATFRGDRRCLDNVERCYAIGLDHDSGELSPADAAAFWDGALGVVHSTKSHTPERPRIRVVLPLSRPVNADEYRRAWRWCTRRVAIVDRATSDPSRLWYLPSLPADGAPVVMPLWGRSLDVARILEEVSPEPEPAPERIGDIPMQPHDVRVRRARAYLEAMGPAISGSGGHTHTFRAALALRGFGIDEGTALALLSEWNHTCQPPWRERDLRRKVREAFRRGRAIAPGSLLERAS
jgi:hypothetical protein